MTTLQLLTISDNRLEGTISSEIAILGSLTFLDVRENDEMAIDFRALHQWLPQCQILYS